MRPSQFTIRAVVFLCIVLDPGDGGAGVVIGVTLGALIGLTVGGVKLLLKSKQNDEDEFDDFDPDEDD